MAPKKPKTPKQQWIADNRERIMEEEGLKGKALERKMEKAWTAERKAREADAARAPVPGALADPDAPTEAPAAGVPAGEGQRGGGEGEEQDPPATNTMPKRKVNDGETLGGGEGVKRPRKASESEAIGHQTEPPADSKPWPEHAMDAAAMKTQRRLEGLANVPDQPDGTHWQSGRLLGSGSFGSAFIWFQLDDQGNVVDRVVVKDCYVAASRFCELHNWHGDPRDPGTREHAEIAAMRLVVNRPGAHNIVHYRGHSVDDERRWYRVYMGFCPHGDLQNAIEYYRPPEYVPPRTRTQKCTRCDKTREIWLKTPAQEALDKKVKWGLVDARLKDGDDYQATLGANEEFIPEAFIWSVFQSMTEACLVLEYGGVELHEAEPGWQVIVHRDIKPANIYLDTPGEDFQSYPRARIGDFGFALLTNESDVLNPMAYAGGQGTPGWRAPEQMDMLNRTTCRPKFVGKLLSPTNVWSIGTLTIALMNRCSNCSGTDFDKDGDEPVIDEIATERYSEALRKLAQRCVKFWPEERILLRELWQEIRERNGLSSEEGEVDHASKMRFQGAAGDKNLELVFSADKYRIGLALGPEDTDGV